MQKNPYLLRGFRNPAGKRGKFYEKVHHDFEIEDYGASFDEQNKYAITGAEMLKQIPGRRIIEIETGRGCKVGKCSFCTEPIKSKFANRKMESVVAEVKAYYKERSAVFPIGKTG